MRKAWRFEELPEDIQKQLLAEEDEREQSKIRHRQVEVHGCICAGCKKLRVAEQEEYQHNLFLKALRGLRFDHSLRDRSLVRSSLVRGVREVA